MKKQLYVIHIEMVLNVVIFTNNITQWSNIIIIETFIKRRIDENIIEGAGLQKGEVQYTEKVVIQ